jgi:hypothetical protein
VALRNIAVAIMLFRFLFLRSSNKLTEKLIVVNENVRRRRTDKSILLEFNHSFAFTIFLVFIVGDFFLSPLPVTA